MEGSLIAGRYIINGIIGSGGMAIVYRGYDRETGEEVAVKVLRSEFMQDEAYVRRFEKESQIAIKYSHKNIVKTIGTGCEDGRHYIVMEYVVGMTLKEYIAQQGRLKPPEVVRIGKQICDALFYAHSHQLIHRDIKPQNILMSRDGVVKVADFGIAKAPETSTVTISGSNVLGSVHYISPEQARGGVTDEKSDIYSIGIVLYEMVTGVVPFTGDTPVAVALRHLQDAPKPPRELVPETPKALELVILKAISKELPARYDNAREMARDLERSILEPEGSYVKIVQIDEAEGGTRPIHAIKAESLSMQQTGGAYSNTGPRRPVPPPHDDYWRRRRRPSTLNVILYVLLAISLLGGAYLGIRALLDSAVPTVKVPPVEGLDIVAAETQLKAVNLKYNIEPKSSIDKAKDTIIGQDPPAGQDVALGDTVTLTVSTGPQQVKVPDVSNKSLDDAQKLIEDSSLKVGDVRKENSDKPKGIVLRQDPQPNEMLPINGLVNIWISDPSQSTDQGMPNVFGKTKQAAMDQLTARGVDSKNIKIVEKNSSYIAGTVIGQSPDAGAKLDSSTTVELQVSNGTPPGYQKKVEVKLSVTQDKTQVKYVFIDGDEKKTVYEQTYDKGDYDITLTLDSMTIGDKELVVYFNGTEANRFKVTFP